MSLPHPPLDKVWSGLAWSAARFALDDLTAHRLGNILLGGALVGMLYHMVATSAGPVAGLAAAAALLTMPRFFFHDQLRSDLRITWPEARSSVFGHRAEGVPIAMDEADYVVLYRETGFTDEIRRYLHGRTPVYRLTCQGIPSLEIYER